MFCWVNFPNPEPSAVTVYVPGCRLVMRARPSSSVVAVSSLLVPELLHDDRCTRHYFALAGL